MMRFYRAVMTAIVIYLLGNIIIAAAAPAPDDGQMISRSTAGRFVPANINTSNVSNALESESVEAEPEYYVDIPLPAELQKVLKDECEAHGIPYAIGLGLIDGESGFRTDAVSSEGCYGLCQLNPRYFPAGLTPAENIRAGIGYLAEQIERYGGDVEAGLTAYNAGHDNGTRWYAGYIMDKTFRWARLMEDETEI